MTQQRRTPEPLRRARQLARRTRNRSDRVPALTPNLHDQRCPNRNPGCRLSVDPVARSEGADQNDNARSGQRYPGGQHSEFNLFARKQCRSKKERNESNGKQPTGQM